ncbi:hypothetical protein [Pseudorhodoferax sp. Leaf267]|uniref:hypothetical protein n=1 Tax=Pseudorhodoferax sp. Leaf267 TaxID=1736316 RepID=UPI0006F4EF1E|nr:hypothetical protein [Pseudorhodoferax sp. Leaf267]KQP17880.1 hypothetical protein ASF43_08410 [Pseudorhodoferax sp. Leaf267]
MTDRTAFEPGVRHWLLGSCGGLLLWASSFVALYALLSLGCQAGWQARPMPLGNGLSVAMATAWLVHLLALAALWTWFARRWPPHGLLPRLARTLTAIALVATVWTGWPVLALPPCAGLATAAPLPPHQEAPCSTT